MSREKSLLLYLLMMLFVVVEGDRSVTHRTIVDDSIKYMPIGTSCHHCSHHAEAEIWVPFMGFFYLEWPIIIDMKTD